MTSTPRGSSNGTIPTQDDIVSQASSKFNKKPKSGIEYLNSCGLVSTEDENRAICQVKISKDNRKNIFFYIVIRIFVKVVFLVFLEFKRYLNLL